MAKTTLSCQEPIRIVVLAHHFDLFLTTQGKFGHKDCNLKNVTANNLLIGSTNIFIKLRDSRKIFDITFQNATALHISADTHFSRYTFQQVIPL